MRIVLAILWMFILAASSFAEDYKSLVVNKDLPPELLRDYRSRLVRMESHLIRGVEVEETTIMNLVLSLDPLDSYELNDVDDGVEFILLDPEKTGIFDEIISYSAENVSYPRLLDEICYKNGLVWWIVGDVYFTPIESYKLAMETIRADS